MFVENPFVVYPILDKDYLEKMTTNVDINIRGKITNQDDEAKPDDDLEKHDEDNLIPMAKQSGTKAFKDRKDGVVSSSRESKLRDISPTAPEKIRETRKVGSIKGKPIGIYHKTETTETPREHRISYSINNLYWLDLLIVNLEKFRTVYYKNQAFFQSHPISIFKYFNDVILLPSIFSLYKIIYFSANISAKIKYFSYKVIYLFFECLKFFLSKLDGEFVRKNIDMAGKYLIFKDENNGISEIMSVERALDFDIQQMNSPQFELLNMPMILDLWKKHVIIFKAFNRITNDQINH